MEALPSCRLTLEEHAELARAATALVAAGADPGAPDFYDCTDPTGLLPDRLTRFLGHFRRREPAAAALVVNLPLGPTAPPPTPPSWRAALEDDATRVADTVLGLCGLVLGEPFAWLTLQDGRLVQNVLPVRGEEMSQSGHGSRALLEFHSEDGFHPDRPDYLLLLGLRNEDAVPTVVASVRDVELTAATRGLLREARFLIHPDPEHLRQLASAGPDHPALAEVRRRSERPEPAVVLSGDPRFPYVRLDRPFMRTVDGHPDTEAALDELVTALEQVGYDITVGPGDLLVVDNRVAVHGRPAFAARYDGTDRWLKKLLVRRDIRRFDTAPGESHRVRM